MMGNGGLGLELDLREEIKGEDQRDKREEKEREKGLLAIEESWRKRRKKENQRKGRKERDPN